MKLVINVPDYIKEQADDGKAEEFGIPPWLAYEIANGTPLPKQHGRLIDADDIRVIELEDHLHIIRHEQGDKIDVYIDAPTIIEADTESEEQ